MIIAIFFNVAVIKKWLTFSTKKRQFNYTGDCCYDKTKQVFGYYITQKIATVNQAESLHNEITFFPVAMLV